MAIAGYIKEIGRGHAGARALSSAQAQDLMGQVLDGAVTDLEIGAFVLAMRIKGETVDELLGFADAIQARTALLHSDRPVVAIPSYNGARRLPNLTALLALQLARSGARVLVHGPRRDPARVTTAEVFEALGLGLAADEPQVHAAWARGAPAFVATETLNPALQRLLDVRRVVGVRNAGHSVAKLMQPVTGAPLFGVANYTHPEFSQSMADFAARRGINLMLLRGTEGEPVADARRAPRLDTWLGGQWRTELSAPAQEGSLGEVPRLPKAIDAATTARYVQAVVDGDEPLPAPIALQATLVTRALQALAGP